MRRRRCCVPLRARRTGSTPPGRCADGRLPSGHRWCRRCTARTGGRCRPPARRGTARPTGPVEQLVRRERTDGEPVRQRLGAEHESRSAVGDQRRVLRSGQRRVDQDSDRPGPSHGQERDHPGALSGSARSTRSPGLIPSLASTRAARPARSWIAPWDQVRPGSRTAGRWASRVPRSAVPGWPRDSWREPFLLLAGARVRGMPTGAEVRGECNSISTVDRSEDGRQVSDAIPRAARTNFFRHRMCTPEKYAMRRHGSCSKPVQRPATRRATPIT